MTRLQRYGMIAVIAILGGIISKLLGVKFEEHPSGFIVVWLTGYLVCLVLFAPHD